MPIKCSSETLLFFIPNNRINTIKITRITRLNHPFILRLFTLLFFSTLNVNSYAVDKYSTATTLPPSAIQSIDLANKQIKYLGRVTKQKQFSLTGSGLSFNITGGNIWASFYIHDNTKAALNVVINFATR